MANSCCEQFRLTFDVYSKMKKENIQSVRERASITLRADRLHSESVKGLFPNQAGEEWALKGASVPINLEGGAGFRFEGWDALG